MLRGDIYDCVSSYLPQQMVTFFKVNSLGFLETSKWVLGVMQMAGSTLSLLGEGEIFPSKT